MHIYIYVYSLFLFLLYYQFRFPTCRSLNDTWESAGNLNSRDNYIEKALVGISLVEPENTTQKRKKRNNYDYEKWTT